MTVTRWTRLILRGNWLFGFCRSEQAPLEIHFGPVVFIMERKIR